MNNLFGVKGLTFSGFLDVWGETNSWVVKDNSLLGYHSETTDWVILSEPQLWYNIGQHFGCENLNIGGEVELAYNFTGAYPSTYNDRKGFTFAPAAGIKWNF
jgi:hypothetical protein